MTDLKIQLVINKYNNKKKRKIKLSSSFLISLIFFLIYINKIFNKVLQTNFLVISLFFVDDLNFIALKNLLKEIVKIFEKVIKKNRTKNDKCNNL